MASESPSFERGDAVVPSGEDPSIIEVQKDENTPKKLTGLLIVAVVVIAGLILAGLSLPPISLWQRLQGDAAEQTALTNMAGSGTAADTSSIPGEMTLSVSDGTINVGVSSVPRADFLSGNAGDAWTAAAEALPANLTLQSNLYAIHYEETVPEGQIAVAFPADSEAETLDLYGWDGTAWRFMPAETDLAKEQVISAAGPLPQAVALVEAAAPENIAIGAEVLPTQALPTEVLPQLTEVTAGTLTLAEDGTLKGKVTAVPTGPYEQLLRVTNTGAIVDQVSLSNLLNDAAAQSSQIDTLVEQALSGEFAGVNLDYQGVASEHRDAFTTFVNDLAAALHAQDLMLAVTLNAPRETSNGWDSSGQDWAAIGRVADVIYLQGPSNPAAYADNGSAEQLVRWATGQINRYKINWMVSANAVDGIGESFLEKSNEQALSHFGKVQLTEETTEEVEAGEPVAVALSGTATPLEWDGASLTYRYSYDQSGQTHHVWLGNEAAVDYRARFAQSYHLRGVTVRGLGNVDDGTGYAATFEHLAGAADAPQTSGAAIVWTVRDESDGVLASSSGSDLTFSWEGSENPGTYTINADFALGDSVATLGSLDVNVALPVTPGDPGAETLVGEEEEEEGEEATAATAEETEETSPSTAEAPEPAAPDLDPGEADGVVNVNANVRVGPGLSYGTIAGGLNAGSKVSLIGRNGDSSWWQITMPDGTEGWIFASLVTVNADFDTAALPVVEVDPPVASAGGDGDSGDAGSSSEGEAAPPPIQPANISGGFELGGQTHSFANPALMSEVGMNWVKFQHKWGNGDNPEAVAGRIQSAHANGFKVLLSIPGADHSNIDYDAYVNFLAGVAALGPDAIEVWNEQNIDREWPSGQIDPATYVNRMLAPAYNAIKAANPNVMVISGAPAPTGFFGGCSGAGCNDDLYVAGMAAAGAANYMDCIGIHYNEGIISPHQTSGDPRGAGGHYTRYFWGMVNTYWNAFGGARKLCFTELGYLSGEDYGGLPGGFAWANSTSVGEHAQWLAEAVSLSASSGKVRLLIIFNVDFTTYGADPQAGYAMIRKDGSCPSCETIRRVMGR